MASQSLLQTLLDGPLAISGTTVNVTNDIVRGEAVNITNADAVLTNRKKTVFELVKVNIINNAVTLSKRGLTKANTVVEDASLKLPRKKGDYLYITVLAPNIFDINSATDFSGYTRTFGDTIHTGYTAFTGYNSTTGISNPGVIFPELTEVQMQALTPIGPAIINNTTDGEFYKFAGGTWTVISTGGTFPNASETVAGKVEQATAAQQGASTELGETGAPLFVNPKNLVKTSSGAADENKVPVLNADGQIASGFMNATSLVNAITPINTPTIRYPSVSISYSGANTYYSASDITHYGGLMCINNNFNNSDLFTIQISSDNTNRTDYLSISGVVGNYSQADRVYIMALKSKYYRFKAVIASNTSGSCSVVFLQEFI